MRSIAMSMSVCLYATYPNVAIGGLSHGHISNMHKQEAQLLLGMADRTGPVVKLSYLRELVWQPSWELDNCLIG